MTIFQQIHKNRIEFELQDRYQSELQELRNLSFGEMRHMRESGFPFSGVLLFGLYPFMKFKGEIVRIQDLFRLVVMYPVLFNREYDSFASVISKGVIFTTGFSDGSQLVSTSFPGREFVNPEKKFYRYTPEQALSIEDTWNFHRDHLLELERKSRLTVADVSVDYFEKLARRNNKALLFKH